MLRVEGTIWGKDTEIGLHQTLLREAGGKGTLIRHVRCISYTEEPAWDAKSSHQTGLMSDLCWVSIGAELKVYMLLESYHKDMGLGALRRWAEKVLKKYKVPETSSWAGGWGRSRFQDRSNKGIPKSVIPSAIHFFCPPELNYYVLLVPIKTSLYSILVLSFFALQKALIFLFDCWACKQFFSLTVLRKVMKLCLHSQLWSIPW